MGGERIVHVEGLTVRYGRKSAVEDVSFSVQRAEQANPPSFVVCSASRNLSRVPHIFSKNRRGTSAQESCIGWEWFRRSRMHHPK
jgi:hypothetical protein